MTIDDLREGLGMVARQIAKQENLDGPLRIWFDGNEYTWDPNGNEEIAMSDKDPWKHRSKGMQCRTCMWFVAKAPRVDFGRCRKRAPTMNGYPAVFEHDWCGDHKLDEATLDK